MALAKNEEIYIDKIARGRAMAKALDEAWKHLKLGSWVTIREYPATGSNGRTLSGRVIFKNEHYFTIQAKRYRESFMWVDVVTGKIGFVGF